MKNTLLTTTALAMTAGAAFAESAVKVKVGGFFNSTVGISSVDLPSGDTRDFDGIDVLTNAEIIFKPSITLDNGIKIGAEVQLEAGSGTTNGSGTSDVIDEAFLSITGDFGQVLIGSENSAGYKQTVSAPDVSHVFASSTSLTAFVPLNGADLFRGTLGTTFLENDRNNDANRLTYFSPRFGGLQLGLSYARDAGQDNGPVDSNAVLTDIVDLSVNYGGSFGGVDINASARYGIANAHATGNGTGYSDDPEVYGAGLNIGFAGFTIGGSYAEQEGTENRDGDAYDIGVSYANGPMSYSLTYFSGSNANAAATVTNPNVAEDELDIIVAAARYQVNSNFAVSGAISQVTEDVAGVEAVDATVVSVSAAFSF